MTRGSWAPLLCLAIATASLPAAAQTRDGVALTEDQTKAQQHFQRARELYQAGSYREAVGELEVARKLDPKAKDLVMNLGIVHEKLGKYDEALAFFKAYLEMEGVTAGERAKAESIIKRVEGAKREAAEKAPPPATTTTSPSAPATSSPVTSPSAAPRGRIDALTIGVGALAGIGLLGGAALGIVAVTSRPDGFVTGRDGSYATLQQRTEDAHTLAIVADVSVGVGIVAAAATAWLYLGRTKSTAGARVVASPTPGGGLLFAGGTF